MCSPDLLPLTVNTLLYLFARVVIGCIQCLPLSWVARLGRIGGYLFWCLDARHRKIARDNIGQAFPDKTESEVTALACENFKRIGENFACGTKTASLSDQAVSRILTVKHADRLQPNDERRWIFAVGHFGNFEMYARASQFLGDYRIATTYRGLRQPAFDRLLLHLREQSGSLFFERRKDGRRMKEALREGNLMLGLLADQHAGDRGARLPFFGRECSTSTAPAVFALRYRCPLHVAICYRDEIGHWSIEIGEEIPTMENGTPRAVEAISADVNAAYEEAIRRDPANWFWVHRRWKPASRIQVARAAAKPLPSDADSGDTANTAD